jgi:beta-galactosidase
LHLRYIVFLFLTGALFAQQSGIPNRELSSLSDTPPIAMTPLRVTGVRQSHLNLNGTWEFTTTPRPDVWSDTSAIGWKPILVPGEPMMQGFVIKHDVENAYRRAILIPKDFKGKRVIIRFNGVYSQARVWVNGQFVREHNGGFTSWDCDVTTLVKAGHSATIIVGVTDRTDEISFASGYAKHPIGGILRGVELLALPSEFVQTLAATVHFDSVYHDAVLSIEAHLNKPADASLEFSLIDPSGRTVALSASVLRFSKSQSTAFLDIFVSSPLHWDAEHPQLYTLRSRLVQNGTMTEVISQRIGFREVLRRGNKLCINGMPVKLRGACRHDIHPLLGRSTTPEQDKLDVRLAKEANFNFIRTSHYPPSREFLDYCDEYGLFVEEETALCFVGTHRHEPYKSLGASQNDRAFTNRYLSQLKEMIDRDRNHPSVIIWSIGNENEYGSNFQAEYRLVKSMDRSRPVMFSYPGYVPKDSTCFDIVSIHYVSYDGKADQLGIAIKDFGLPTIPVLHDEWAHVPCYNTPTLTTDLNVRNFWGESLKRMWDACFESDGLGGAIWGYIDETFMLPDIVVGYGPWGIIDTWRRKKPEFWLTRKAYSPVRVQQTQFAATDVQKGLIIPLYNRFDHTNLKELQIQVASGKSIYTTSGPDVSPHSKGVLILPRKVIAGNKVKVAFLHNTMVVDDELLTLGNPEKPAETQPKNIQALESDTSIVVLGVGFTVTFNKRTGLVENGSVDGKRVILSGPYLHLTSSGGPINWIADSLLDLTGTQWHLLKMTSQRNQTDVRMLVDGRSGEMEVHFEIMVDGNGKIRTSYEIQHLPEKYREVGIRYIVDKELTSLSWKRDALYSLYPDDHIGRPVGTASKASPSGQREAYRNRPIHSWSLDTRDYFFYGKEGRKSAKALSVPVDFKTTKENVLSYSLTDSGTRRGITVTSDKSVAARAVANEDGTTTIVIMNDWNYANLRWGNYERAKQLPPHYKGEVTLQLTHGRATR